MSDTTQWVKTQDSGKGVQIPRCRITSRIELHMDVVRVFRDVPCCLVSTVIMHHQASGSAYLETRGTPDYTYFRAACF